MDAQNKAGNTSKFVLGETKPPSPVFSNRDSPLSEFYRNPDREFMQRLRYG